MIINTHHIKEAGRTLDFSLNAGRFRLLSGVAEKEKVLFASPVTVTVFAEIVGSYVCVRGTAFISISQECCRCLEPFDRDYRRKFQLTYSRMDSDEIPPGDTSDYRRRALERGVYLYGGDMIDLTEGVQEHLVLMVSGRPLCSEGCRGLCPGCGENLNMKDCSCEASSGESVFEALKGLMAGP